MSNWKEKISLRNCSSANIAALCWCGTILAGNLLEAMKTGNYIDLPFHCAFLTFLFLIQLATAIILGECYNKTRSAIHHRILIVLGVLHGILMLGDMSLLLWLGSFLGCFILSIVLFLVTGIYLMLLRKRWQGIVVALFSLIAWIQPVFFFVCQQ